MNEPGRQWIPRGGLFRSSGPQSRATPDTDGPLSCSDKEATQTGTTLVQRMLRPFPVRFAVVYGVAMLMLLGVQLVTGGESINLSAALDLVICGLIAACRGRREIHLIKWALVVYDVVVLLPIAVVVNDFDLWLTFVLGAVVAVVTWTMCLYRRLVNRRPMTVWVSLPSGQDVLLDTRPFLCGICRRVCDHVHHVAFAPERNIDLPPAWLAKVWVEKPRRASADVVLAVESVDEGLRLVAAPDEFAQKQWTGSYAHQWAEEPTARR